MAFQHLLEVLKPLVSGSFEVSCVCMATRPTIDLNCKNRFVENPKKGFAIPKDQQKQKQQKAVPNQGAEFTIFGRAWLVTTLTCLCQCIITGLTAQVILQDFKSKKILAQKGGDLKQLTFDQTSKDCPIPLSNSI